MRNITVAMGVSDDISLVLDFYNCFRKHHPDVPLSFGALQLKDETVKCLKELQSKDELLTVVYGNPKDGHHVSFSENFNAAINGVKTSKLVLGHTDVVFCNNFFDVLEEEVKLGNFYIYTTIEPPIYIGFRRPGKIIGSFGDSFSNFDFDRFEKYVSKLQSNAPRYDRGYGFFLAGYKEDFENVGGFDMLTFNPIFCEDDDISLRIRLKGYTMTVLDHAITYHFVSKSSRTVKQRIPSASEVEMNKKFAMKWGFETRLLRRIGYEYIDSPINIYDVMIGIENCSEDIKMILEPLLGQKPGKEPDVICHLKTSTLEELLPFLGSLKFLKFPKKGNYNFKVAQVQVLNENCKCLVDTNNYLSLQREIKYE